MKSILLSLVFLFAVSACARSPIRAIRVDQFDLKAEGINGFEPRAEAFIKILEAADNTTRGLITIYENEEAAAKLNQLLLKKPDLLKRIQLFVPGVKYPKQGSHVEFWLLPNGANSPYVPDCALGICDCSSISVSGLDEYTLGPLLTFVAEVNGGDQDSVEYAWSVEGGEIVKGQGTPKIKVKPVMSDPKDITATLEIKGTNPVCGCPTTASSTSKLRL